MKYEKLKNTSTVMWAIWHPWCGFYCGTFLSRKTAINEFVQNRNSSDRPYNWSDAYTQGNRAVKVKLEMVI